MLLWLDRRLFARVAGCNSELSRIAGCNSTARRCKCATVWNGRTGTALGAVGGSLIALVAEYFTSRTYVLGRCDCRFSAAIYNDQMLIAELRGAALSP